ncbi:MAG: pyridoxal phosphate-dependent aminotransferase [Clostridiales bacterium]|nr:pyridoxal phosphate-dependent aminotransferase [Clostridiales bacterium]
MAKEFNKIINRRGTNSLKWDVGDNELPMWVADMDFQTAKCVTDAIVAKARCGVFGYQIVPNEWYEAIINWWRTRHDFVIDKNWLCFCTGVVPAITSCVKRLTNLGDNVVVLTPVYDIFFHSIENTGRHTLECPLVYENGRYGIDFADLERKLADSLSTMLILCNPHNPVGKVWTRDELKRIGDLCAKHGVTVFSDEIHCDLTAPDTQYVPFASASEKCNANSVTAISASKAFNLAGLQSAAIFAKNEQIRNKVVRGLNSDELAEPNAFAIEAICAAFSSEGALWLDGLREHIAKNKATVVEFLNRNLPEVKSIEQDATYLMWLDCSAITDDAESLCDFIRAETGLFVSAGNKYRGNGKYFLRLNVACPEATLTDGLNRLKEGINLYIAKQ